MQTLKLGSKGAEVEHLQTHLNLNPDGIFGKITEEVVKEFQRTRHLTVDGIVGPKTWELVLRCPPATCTECHVGTDDYPLIRTTRPITRIIIHCSATPEDKDYTVEDITRWHKERGYATIGYHYVITRDGLLYPGRSINQVGAHCQGYNTGSIGICYIGGLEATAPGATVPAGSPAGKPKDTRTEQQRSALRKLVNQLQRIYPNATVHGHNEFSNKACPSFNVQKEL